jgi:CRISPR-associated protein (TIGR02584 family)
MNNTETLSTAAARSKVGLDMNQPKIYNEILILALGTTPQLVTEAIYALYKSRPTVIYDEIFIITTSVGRNMLKKFLIDENKLAAMSKDMGVKFTVKNNSFIVPKYDNGVELDDIKTSSDNQIIANSIVSLIKEKTGTASNRIHAFLSGGRKTMSFYMGIAMELYSRPWDKTYHILVSEQFESNKDFYYKPVKNKQIISGENTLNTDDAEIMLIDLPMIRLRNKIKMDISDFKTALEYGQKEIDTSITQPSLKINLRNRQIFIDNYIAIELTPIQLMVYTTYLKFKLNNCKYPQREYCKDCSECFPSLLDLTTKPALEEMAKIYRIISPAKVDILLQNYKDGIGMEVMRQSISKIKKIIHDTVKDETVASLCIISTANKNYGNTRHGIKIEKRKILISPDI